MSFRTIFIFIGKNQRMIFILSIFVLSILSSSSSPFFSFFFFLFFLFLFLLFYPLSSLFKRFFFFLLCSHSNRCFFTLVYRFLRLQGTSRFSLTSSEKERKSGVGCDVWKKERERKEIEGGLTLISFNFPRFDVGLLVARNEIEGDKRLVPIKT